jgi:hypothetical protein
LENSWLFHHLHDAEYLQKAKWESGKLESFAPDHSSRWLKLKALSKLNIMQFLDTDRVWTNDSQEVQKFLKDGKRKDVLKILGNPGKNGIKYINRLLRLIGVSLVCRQTRGKDKKQVYTYRYQTEPELRLTKKGPVRICSLPEDWSALSELTALRMSQKVEAKKASTKSAENTAPSVLEAVIDGADLINIQSEPSMTETTPENPTAGSASGAISHAATEGKAEAEPPIANRTGWVSSLGQWVAAKVIGWCEEGTRYRILYETKSGEWSEMLAFPSQIRWGQTFSDPSP